MGHAPGLLEVARDKMRTRHLALRTEQAYLQWIWRYVRFHGHRHPRDLGAEGVEQFLTHLTVRRKASLPVRTRLQDLSSHFSMPAIRLTNATGSVSLIRSACSAVSMPMTSS